MVCWSCVCVGIALFFGIVYWVIQYLNSLTISDVTSKTVLITGCDSGFGNLLTKKLDQMGIKVLSGCLTEDGIQNLKNQTSNNVHVFKLDVTKPEDIENAYELTKSKCPEGLWGIVNNAGIFKGWLMEFTTMEDHKKVMEVNYFGMVMMTQKFLPLLRKSKGRIINICSIAGQLGFPGLSSYCASKYSCEAFSDGLRREMNLFGVDVVIIEPGFTNTAIVQNSHFCIEENWKKSSEDLRVEYGGEKFYQNQMKLIGLFEKYAGDPSHVVNALVSSLVCKKPKHRYLVGVDAHLLWKPLMILPPFLSDPIFLFLM